MSAYQSALTASRALSLLVCTPAFGRMPSSLSFSTNLAEMLSQWKFTNRVSAPVWLRQQVVAGELTEVNANERFKYRMFKMKDGSFAMTLGEPLHAAVTAGRNPQLSLATRADGSDVIHRNGLWVGNNVLLMCQTPFAATTVDELLDKMPFDDPPLILWEGERYVMVPCAPRARGGDLATAAPFKVALIKLDARSRWIDLGLVPVWFRQYVRTALYYVRRGVWYPLCTWWC